MTDRDRALHKGLLKLINDADFTLKAREVGPFLEIIGWVKDLDKNMVRKPEKQSKSGKVTNGNK